MTRRSAGTLVVLGCALLLALPAAAQSLRFEKTVNYNLDRLIELETTVGAVKVHSVQFSQEAPSGAGKLFGKLRGADPEIDGNIGMAFDCENPEAKEWQVTFTLDFLDSKGKLIDRASTKEALEGQAKIATASHTTLKYVLPQIDKVKIRIEAKLD